MTDSQTHVIRMINSLNFGEHHEARQALLDFSYSSNRKAEMICYFIQQVQQGMIPPTQLPVPPAAQHVPPTAPGAVSTPSDPAEAPQAQPVQTTVFPEPPGMPQKPNFSGMNLDTLKEACKRYGLPVSGNHKPESLLEKLDAFWDGKVTARQIALGGVPNTQ